MYLYNYLGAMSTYMKYPKGSIVHKVKKKIHTIKKSRKFLMGKMFVYLCLFVYLFVHSFIYLFEQCTNSLIEKKHQNLAQKKFFL